MVKRDRGPNRCLLLRLDRLLALAAPGAAHADPRRSHFRLSPSAEAVTAADNPNSGGWRKDPQRGAADIAMHGAPEQRQRRPRVVEVVARQAAEHERFALGRTKPHFDRRDRVEDRLHGGIPTSVLAGYVGKMRDPSCGREAGYGSRAVGGEDGAAAQSR